MSTMANIIKERADRIIDRDVKPHWNATKVKGNADYKSKIIKDDDDSVIIRYKFFGQKVWITEYGRGSSMAKANQNPYLKKYIGSEIWNKHRPTTNTPYAYQYAIYSRPKGEYSDLDGKPHEGSGLGYKSDGSGHGWNLEKPRLSNGKIDRDTHYPTKQHPHVPHFYIKRAFTGTAMGNFLKREVAKEYTRAFVERINEIMGRHK